MIANQMRAYKRSTHLKENEWKINAYLHWKYENEKGNTEIYQTKNAERERES